MNRDQKAVVIDEIAANINDSQAIFAVDFRGITVPQAAELRDKLRAVDASFRVVKNSLTERAADRSGVVELKELLAGPTALTFVRGDAATAAKTIADYARITQRLAFKGGVMDGVALTPEQVSAISRLLSREALYGQLVGLVASPLTGLVRTLNALIGGLAIQLGAILEKKESGEIPAGDPPAAAAAPPVAESASAADAPAPAVDAPAPAVDAPAPAVDASAPAVDASAPAVDAPAPAVDAPAPAVDAPAPAVDAPAPAADVAADSVISDPGVSAAETPAEETPEPSPPESPQTPETPAMDEPPAPVADPPVDEPAHPAEDAQAEEAPAAAAPATDQPSSTKENH